MMGTDQGQMNTDVTVSDQQQPTPVIFLPGIIMPAALRYVPLLNELRDSVRAVTKDLEVYASLEPPADYSIQFEVEGITRAADAAGFHRFHLYGHSAGGTCALAYVATYPERVLSLALDEPATDFSSEDRAALRNELEEMARLREGERIHRFLGMQLAPGVEPPPPPSGAPPPWMHSRPAGIDAFTDAMLRYSLPDERLGAFDRPVYYSYGSLSSRRWAAMSGRLGKVFADFESELYEGVHHLNTSHQREPARVASALRKLWSRAEQAATGGAPT